MQYMQHPIWHLPRRASWHCVGCLLDGHWLVAGRARGCCARPSQNWPCSFRQGCHTKQAILLEEGRPQNSTVLQSVRVRMANSDSRHLDSRQRCERLACYQMLLPTMLQSVRVKRASAQQVLRILAEMRSVSVLPDVVTYNAAISACEKSEQWQQALGVLAEKRKISMLLDVITYSSAISACAKGEQWQQDLDSWQRCERLVCYQALPPTMLQSVRV